MACVDNACVDALCAACTNEETCGDSHLCVVVGVSPHCVSPCSEVEGTPPCSDGYQCVGLPGADDVCVPMGDDCDCPPTSQWTCADDQNRALLGSCGATLEATAELCEFGCEDGTCCEEPGCEPVGPPDESAAPDPTPPADAAIVEGTPTEDDDSNTTSSDAGGGGDEDAQVEPDSPPAASSSGGCQQGVAQNPKTPLAILLLVLLVVLAIRRRAQPT